MSRPRPNFDTAGGCRWMHKAGPSLGWE
jgi:hypothetical protein